ncbi:hypothetical protein CYMTET_37732 [Cymbomonas tetramitiformis]|uniref:Uncharacterized protein n=1 Tax=Cymbomonas tetramitiformis TaxID=36881 RepID=A0AAE0CDC6_9CHLO|nr:hypothetical protein CYMTET_37732 [Cymbomonas tetramitiformis]
MELPSGANRILRHTSSQIVSSKQYPIYYFLIFIVASSHLCAQSIESGEDSFNQETQQAGISVFFDLVDKDGDGQIEPEEASKFFEEVGGTDFDTAHEIEASVDLFLGAVDGSDIGGTIDEDELEAHLNDIMTCDEVVRWVTHGLQLPQYAEAFRANAITALDFPMLLTTSAMDEELGVKSKLHRKQLTRSMKKKISGQGVVPGQPEQLSCEGLSPTSIAVLWHMPANLGRPRAHGYELERKSLRAPKWQPISHGPASHEELQDSYIDETAFSGEVYSYRLLIWGQTGHGDYAYVEGCTTNADMVPTTPGAPEPNATHEVYALHVDMEMARTAVVWVTIIGLAMYSIYETHRGHFRPRVRTPLASPSTPGAASMEPHGGSMEVSTAAEAWNKIHSSEGSHIRFRGDPTLQSSRPRIHTLHTSVERPAVQTVSVAGEGLPEGVGFGSGDFALEEIEPEGFDSPMRNDSSGISLQENEESLLTMKPSASMSSLGDRSGDSSADEEGNVTTSRDRKGRRCCAYPGCERRWDGWYKVSSIKMKFMKHCCGKCQFKFCHKHTRISPHGNHGRCGSSCEAVYCWCHECFNNIEDDDFKARLEKGNKLIHPQDSADLSTSDRAKMRWQQVSAVTQVRKASKVNLVGISASKSSPMISATKPPLPARSRS